MTMEPIPSPGSQTSADNPQENAMESQIHTLANLFAQLGLPSEPGAIEAFMRQYDLGSEEGVLLMCVAEALLRIPDQDTADSPQQQHHHGGGEQVAEDAGLLLRRRHGRPHRCRWRRRARRRRG